MAFASCFPIVIFCLHERVLTYFNVSAKLDVFLEHGILILNVGIVIPCLETRNLIFSIVIAILFSFCFRLNTFTNKISNSLLPLRAEGAVVVNVDIPYFSLLLLVAFLLA